MKMLKKIALCFLVLTLAFTSDAAFSTLTVEAAAPSVKKVTVPTISNVSKFDNVSACFSKNVTVTDAKSDTSYFQFTLSSDSWVLFKGSYSFNEHDGAGTHVTFYSDSSFSNKKFEYGWGYWQYDKEGLAFLKKGTYYAMVKTTHENYDDFSGNVNVIGAAIPLSKVFSTKNTVSKGKTYATVSMTSALGSYAECVQYRKGNVGLSNVDSTKYWKHSYAGYWGDGDGATLLTEKNGKYTFKAKKNGSYTFMIEDTDGNRYSRVIKVSGIDQTKPTVTGVKNKKTYTKAVTIKYADKQSGIKSATLNKKKIKSGKRVAKSGKYTLVVTDKAGNKTTIKFTVKLKKK